ncbi:hypothetical protein [Streptomyces achromogenes]|uniref:hypothetical protein n=1 Tax=Streptomyces achromogenes TaxID=67255 RepID=UPI0036BA52D8
MSRARLAAATLLVALAALITPALGQSHEPHQQQAGDIGWGAVAPTPTPSPTPSATTEGDIGWG